ncbi:MAG: hypothetical protein CEO12_319 [Parcubacteria group bacterium Gr01-1014_46]|nr:MAG: hypothetical protein CEO12_319 [Parcubacteria group bacterium Gr01-1014_46]
MSEGNFEINGDDFKRAEEMNPVLRGLENGAEEVPHLAGEIEALQHQIQNLETQHDPKNADLIIDLKKELASLQGKSN